MTVVSIKPKQKTIHTSFTKDYAYLYDLVLEQSERTGIKMATIVCLALEQYYSDK